MREYQSRLLSDVLRAESAGEDLHDCGHYIAVCAMAQDRSLYEIGRVTSALVYQNPDAARNAIQQIKWLCGITCGSDHHE